MTGADKLCVASDEVAAQKLDGTMKIALVVASFSGGVFVGQAALTVGTLLR